MNRRWWSSLLLALGLLAAVPLTASADSFALIFGAGEFSDKQLKPRPTATNDAQAIYDLVTDKATLGIDKANVKLLLSGKDEKRDALPATKENLLKYLKEITGKAAKDDLVFIYMVGQGAAAGDRACVFTSDSTFADRSKNSLFGGDVETAMKDFKSERLCVFLDFNLKGFEPGKESVLEPNIFDFIRAFAGQVDRDEQTLPPGRSIILANGGITPTITFKDHGIFTYSLVEALKGKADKEGYEADGNVTIDELVKFLEKEVPPLAREHGKTNEEKQQVPYLEYARTIHFVLTKNPSETEKVDSRLKKFAEIQKDNKFEKKVSDEGIRLLSRMPKLKSLQELRKTYQELTDGKLPAKEFLAKRETILDGMKLDKEVASSYSSKVLRAIELVRDSYVKELNIGDLAALAIKGMFEKAEETIPEELKQKLTKVKTLKRSELSELLVEARELLGKREDLDGIADIEVSIASAMSRLDPYSGYTEKENVERQNGSVSGTFSGIGVQIRRDLVKDGLLVVSPIKGSPAYKGGMKSGDIIRVIRRPVDNQGNKLEKPEEISTSGMRVDEAVKLILGKPGTEVEIVVEREGVKEPITFQLLRGKVDVETVLGHRRNSDDSWDYYIDPKDKIAYIYLTQFARKSFDDLKKVVTKLNEDGARGVVLDLRFNPGGYLDIAIDICDLFIDDGLIVSTKMRDGTQRSSNGKQDGSFTNFPMVCLINNGSASASEILSACLQDHHRAVIMGERSYGKGSVQSLLPYRLTGGEIKLTTATFWRPNGKNLNRLSTSGKEDEDWGVRPEKEFTLKMSRQERDDLFEHLRDREIIPRRDVPAKETKEYKDKQLDMALEYLRGQIKVGIAPTPKKNKEGKDGEKN
jgi:C-terminal peptidase prc